MHSLRSALSVTPRLRGVGPGALLCLWFGMALAAPAQTPPPPASPAVTPSDAKPALPRRVALGLTGEETLLLAEFPLSLTQNPGIMVPVTLRGKTYTFMLDTGATHTVVDEPLRPLLGERSKQVESEASVGRTALMDLYPPLAEALVGPLSPKADPER